MNKAILVMDMPNNCDVCPLVKMIGNNFLCIPKENSKDFCSVYYQVKNEIKPEWCPLSNMDKLIEDIRCRCYEIGLDESQTEIIISELNLKFR